VSFAKLLLKAWKHFGDDQVARSSAALTFYLILALSPLFLFLAALSSVLLQSQGAANDLQRTLMDTVQHSLGARQAAVLQSFVQSSSSRTTGYLATIAGLTVSLYGASGLFLQLRATADFMWGVKSTGGIKSFFLSRAISILMVFVLGVVIVGWVGMDAWLRIVRLSLRPEAPYGFRQTVSFLLALAFWTPVYGAIYKALSPPRIAWRHVWFGAIFTSLSYSVTKYLLSIYFTFSSRNSSYGAAGAFVVILLWAYYSAQIFFFGLELTKAKADLGEK